MTVKPKLKIISVAAAVIWLLIIWGQSAMPAALSSRESLAFLNLLPEFLRGITEYMVRKIAHFEEFLILGILLDHALRRIGCRDKLAYLAGMPAALVDETIQLFAEGRSSQVTDVWLDFTGYCTGALILLLLLKLIDKARRE